MNSCWIDTMIQAIDCQYNGHFKSGYLQVTVTSELHFAFIDLRVYDLCWKFN